MSQPATARTAAKPTLDQQRAQFAWAAASTAKTALGGSFDAYRNLAKGAPSLIMGNGLMAALAFYASRKDKKESEAGRLLDDLGEWLRQRGLPKGFVPLMEALQKADSREYMRYTEESLAMLRWLRQFADAVRKTEGD